LELGVRTENGSKVGLKVLSHVEKILINNFNLQIGILKECQRVFCGTNFILDSSAKQNSPRKTRSLQRLDISTPVDDLSHPWTILLVFQVTCRNPRTEVGPYISYRCTGFFVSHADIITAAHCFFHDATKYSLCTGDALKNFKNAR
jgi:hypothetical protein